MAFLSVLYVVDMTTVDRRHSNSLRYQTAWTPLFYPNLQIKDGEMHDVIHLSSSCLHSSSKEVGLVDDP